MTQQNNEKVNFDLHLQTDTSIKSGEKLLEFNYQDEYPIPFSITFSESKVKFESKIDIVSELWRYVGREVVAVDHSVEGNTFLSFKGKPKRKVDYLESRTKTNETKTEKLEKSNKELKARVKELESNQELLWDLLGLAKYEDKVEGTMKITSNCVLFKDKDKEDFYYDTRNPNPSVEYSHGRTVKWTYGTKEVLVE